MWPALCIKEMLYLLHHEHTKKMNNAAIVFTLLLHMLFFFLAFSEKHFVSRLNYNMLDSM